MGKIQKISLYQIIRLKQIVNRLRIKEGNYKNSEGNFIFRNNLDTAENHSLA